MEFGQYSYKAVVTRVVDGDTMDLKVDLGFKVSYTIRVRIKGVDAPESYGKNACEEGRVVKVFVKDILEKEDVILETFKDKTGKYGRYLADIHFTFNNETVSLAKLLLDKNMVKVYGS